MNVRETIAGDVLASLTTPIWNVPSKAWTGGAPMADSSLNRRMTVRLGPGVAFAQIGIRGFEGTIELEALRLHGLPEHAPALLCGTPALPVGQRELAAEVSWDLPNLAPAATSLLDVTVANCRVGDLADAAPSSSNSTRRPGRPTPSASWRGISRQARSSISQLPRWPSR